MSDFTQDKVLLNPTLESVQHLLGEKRKLSLNPTICDSFYASTYIYLFKNSPDCWWCTVDTTELVMEMLDVFSMEDTPHSLEFKTKMAVQLSVAEFFSKLSEWDATRLVNKFKNSEFDENILTSIFEALRSPGLILNFPDLYYALELTLEKCILNNSYPKMKSNILFGLSPLSLSSNPLISKWAKKIIKNSEGKYSISLYNSGIKYLLQNIISFLFDPLEYQKSSSKNSIICDSLLKCSQTSNQAIWQSLSSLLNKIDDQSVSRISLDFPNLILCVVKEILHSNSNLSFVLALFKWIFLNYDPINLWEEIGKSLKMVPTDLVLTIINSEFSKSLLNYKDINDEIFNLNYPSISEISCKKALKRLKGLLGWIEPFTQSVIAYSSSINTPQRPLKPLVNLFFNSLKSLWKDGSDIPIINKSATFLISIYFIQFIINNITTELKPFLSEVLPSILVDISEVVTGESEISECDYLVSCAESLISSVLLSDLDIVYDYCSLNELNLQKPPLQNLLSSSLWLKISKTPSNIELVKVTLFITSNLFMIDYPTTGIDFIGDNAIASSTTKIESDKWFTKFRLDLLNQMVDYIICINSSLKDNNKDESVTFEKSILQPLLRFLVCSEYKLISAVSQIATQSYLHSSKNNNPNITFHGQLGLISQSAKVLAQNHLNVGLKELLVLINEWNHLFNNNIPLSRSSVNIAWLINGFISGLPSFESLSAIFLENIKSETDKTIDNNFADDLNDDNENISDSKTPSLEEIISNIYNWIEAMIKSIATDESSYKIESYTIINNNVVISQVYSTESVFYSLSTLFAYCKPPEQTSFDISNILLSLMSKWPNSSTILGYEDLILRNLLNLVTDLQNSPFTLDYEIVSKFSESPISKNTISKNLVESITSMCLNISKKKPDKIDLTHNDFNHPKSDNLNSDINYDDIKDFDIGDELDEFELESLLNSLEKTIPGISNPVVSNSNSEIGSDYLQNENNFSSNIPSSDNEKNDEIDIYLPHRISSKKNKALLSDWFQKETDKNKVYDNKSYKPPTRSKIPNSLISKINSSGSNTSSRNKFDPTSENASLLSQIKKSAYSSAKDSSTARKNAIPPIPNYTQKFERPIAEVPRSLSLHSSKTENNKKHVSHLFDNSDNVITFSRDEFKVNNSSAGVIYNSSSSSDSDSSDSSDSRDKSNGLKALINTEAAKSAKSGLYSRDSHKRSITFQKDSKKRNIASGLIRPVSRLTEAQIKAREEEIAMKRLMPSLNKLHLIILAWSYEDINKLPPNLPRNLKKVPSSFSSVEEYNNIFEPMLLSECWSQLQRSIEETSELPTFSATIQSRTSVDKFGDISLLLDASDASQWAENDMLVLASESKSGSNKVPSIPNKSKNSKNNFAESIRERFKNRTTFIAKVQSITYKKSLATVTIRTNFDKVGNTRSASIMNLLFVNSKWDALKLLSLVPIHREYAALLSLQYLPPILLENILRPRMNQAPNHSNDRVNSVMKSYKVNQPQAQAILSSIDRDGFTLIQGPPGTGKTKTILAILSMLITRDPNYKQITKSSNGDIITPPSNTNSRNGKILVCAPSNAAVDEIVQRLKEGVIDSNGKIFVPKIVRVGQSESINSSVRDLTLDQLVEDQLSRATSLLDSGSTSSINSTDPAVLAITAQNAYKNSLNNQKVLRKQLESIDEERNKARLVEVSLSKSDSTNELIEIQKKISVLSRARNTLLKQLNEQQNQSNQFNKSLDSVRRAIRNQIISHSQIICCTLSGSGHEILASMAKRFETVIIDEAAQSVELSSIIPLKYSPVRCILVGDPNQLPPTVLSREAASFGYEQSLFVRLQQNCPNIVNLLSIQYRMHPEISSFPSKLFYENLLKDGDGMCESKSAAWHNSDLFTPFHFFGVYSREAIGRGHSIYNTDEVNVICSLVLKLISDNPGISFYHRIGIITPYKQQIREFKRTFTNKFGRKVLDSIDFNTVDGFQGQEKDIIFFSCVRSNENGIGFLSDLRRMNVAITRAKNSLFIVADPRAMSSNEKWSMLLESAKSRGMYSDNIKGLLDIKSKGSFIGKNLENLLNEDFDPRKFINTVDNLSTKNNSKAVSDDISIDIPKNTNRKIPTKSNPTNSISIDLCDDNKEVISIEDSSFSKPSLMDGTQIIENILSGSVKPKSIIQNTKENSLINKNPNRNLIKATNSSAPDSLLQESQSSNKVPPSDVNLSNFEPQGIKRDISLASDTASNESIKKQKCSEPVLFNNNINNDLLLHSSTYYNNSPAPLHDMNHQPLYPLENSDPRSRPPINNNFLPVQLNKFNDYENSDQINDFNQGYNNMDFQHPSLPGPYVPSNQYYGNYNPNNISQHPPIINPAYYPPHVPNAQLNYQHVTNSTNIAYQNDSSRGSFIGPLINKTSSNVIVNDNSATSRNYPSQTSNTIPFLSTQSNFEQDHYLSNLSIDLKNNEKAIKSDDRINDNYNKNYNNANKTSTRSENNSKVYSSKYSEYRSSDRDRYNSSDNYNKYHHNSRYESYRSSYNSEPRDRKQSDRSLSKKSSRNRSRSSSSSRYKSFSNRSRSRSPESSRRRPKSPRNDRYDRNYRYDHSSRSRSSSRSNSRRLKSNDNSLRNKKDGTSRERESRDIIGYSRYNANSRREYSKTSESRYTSEFSKDSIHSSRSLNFPSAPGMVVSNKDTQNQANDSKRIISIQSTANYSPFLDISTHDTSNALIDNKLDLDNDTSTGNISTKANNITPSNISEVKIQKTALISINEVSYTSRNTSDLISNDKLKRNPDSFSRQPITDIRTQPNDYKLGKNISKNINQPNKVLINEKFTNSDKQNKNKLSSSLDKKIQAITSKVTKGRVISSWAIESKRSAKMIGVPKGGNSVVQTDISSSSIPNSIPSRISQPSAYKDTNQTKPELKLNNPVLPKSNNKPIIKYQNNTRSDSANNNGSQVNQASKNVVKTKKNGKDDNNINKNGKVHNNINLNINKKKNGNSKNNNNLQRNRPISENKKKKKKSKKVASVKKKIKKADSIGTSTNSVSIIERTTPVSLPAVTISPLIDTAIKPTHLRYYSDPPTQPKDNSDNEISPEIKIEFKTDNNPQTPQALESPNIRKGNHIIW
ncbi:Helicase sen1 [Smittium culicis]|uniref:Helicase sen1 n=1 Tax=Smittium culicis TaxID=133412 RepID=A0A1R1YFT0_9FUNG|nr:Helicase sen1 [Smittium culicis]